jgi:tRNA1(Val) A37 N6-methylase TrmN6
MSMAEALTRDAFLGGKLHLWQPKTGYRAGVDPVLLAASIPAQAGQSVLDLGCGAGAAALCLGTRIPGLVLTGLELQPHYAELARRNGVENGQDFEVVTGDLGALPPELRARQFDHVIANPPYFDRSGGSSAPDTTRETALGEMTPLAVWIDAAARRTRPGGMFSIIYRAERLVELLSLTEARFGGLQTLPLIPRPGRDCQLVLLRARKGSRTPLRLHAGVLLHEGARHDGDRDSYSAVIRPVLRDGAALEFPARASDAR